MKISKLSPVLLAVSLAATPALAEDQTPQRQTADQQQQPQQKHQTSQPQPSNQSAQQHKTMSNKQNKQISNKQAGDITKPKMSANEVMNLTQQAMTHIAAAEQALDKGDKTAAKSALNRSEQVLKRLYDTPPLQAMLNELDEAINALSGEKPALEALDLAPLSASVTSYQAYIDPDVVAGVNQAQQKQKQGDAKGTEEALRMARNRVAVDVALLPVEEAYVRVLGAQQALQKGDTQTASRLLSNVPIVVGEVQIRQPLVPVRFSLNAAAEAAEAKNWDRANALLNQANQQVQQLESAAKDPELKQELMPISNDLQRMTRQARAGTNLQPNQIRELAKRTRSIGMQNEQG